LSTYKPTSNTVPLGFTPEYAAPELLNEKPPIPETDIYGAGLVFMYALGGDVAKKSLPDDIDRRLIDFCTRLIKYDPAERPNWEKEDLVSTVSMLREDIFGRRHIR
jgi:serine/threonine protein kinase